MVLHETDPSVNDNLSVSINPVATFKCAKVKFCKKKHIDVIFLCSKNLGLYEMLPVNVIVNVKIGRKVKQRCVTKIGRFYVAFYFGKSAHVNL